MLRLALLATLFAGPAFAQAGCGRPLEIQFPRGATSVALEGGAVRGEIACYSFTARAGQRLEVSIPSLENNAAFQIYAPGWTDKPGEGPDGRALPGTEPGKDATRFSGALPANGRYLIVAGGTRGNTMFSLRVSIR